MMHFYSPFSIICRLRHINEYFLIHFTILCFGQTALGTPQISLGAPSLGIFFCGIQGQNGNHIPFFLQFFNSQDLTVNSSRPASMHFLVNQLQDLLSDEEHNFYLLSLIH